MGYIYFFLALISYHHQLGTGDLVRAKFYCLYGLANGHWCIWIRDHLDAAFSYLSCMTSPPFDWRQRHVRVWTTCLRLLRAELRPGIKPATSQDNTNNCDSAYGAVIMSKVIARVHPVHLMNADWAPGGRQPLASRLGLWVRYYYSAHKLILILASHKGWKAEST